MPQSDPRGMATAEVLNKSFGPRGRSQGRRLVPEETPVAFSYNGTSYAVMMATAQDLHDFAVGFSLTEGVIDDIAEIEHLDIIEHDLGIELQMRLAGDRADAVAARKRALAGPTGCGLCGVESLEQALRVLPQIAVEGSYRVEQVMAAIAAIAPLQELNRQTHAVHGAAFWTPDNGVVALREDIGRHNALDKLAGALARGKIDPKNGILVLTSRVSIELIQKAAAMRAPVIAAISAPTALAVRSAGFAGITLIAVARDDGFEVFSHPDRIIMERASVG